MSPPEIRRIAGKAASINPIPTAAGGTVPPLLMVVDGRVPSAPNLFHPPLQSAVCTAAHRTRSPCTASAAEPNRSRHRFSGQQNYAAISPCHAYEYEQPPTCTRAHKHNRGAAGFCNCQLTLLRRPAITGHSAVPSAYSLFLVLFSSIDIHHHGLVLG